MREKFSSFDEGFSATIRGISLFDYLQLLIMTKKDKVLEVRSGDFLGIIKLSDGKIVFSKNSLGKEGNDSFYQIMSWKNGIFKDVDLNKPLKKNIDDKGNLLLKAVEFIDSMGANNMEMVESNNTGEFQALYELDSVSCDYINSCSLFETCRSEAIERMWKSLYCETSKCKECRRFDLLERGKIVQKHLLPNGNFLE